MRKIYAIVFVLLGLFLLVGCKPTREVSSIEVVKEDIIYDIVKFKLEDVKIKVNYSDSSNELVPLDKTMISKEDQERLKAPGYYYIFINYKAKTVEMEIYMATLYTVTFGEISTTEVVAGTYLQRPTDPTQEGAFFSGWYRDSALTVEYNFYTAVTSDLHLYPKWDLPSANSSDFEVRYTYYGYSVVRYLGNAQNVVIPAVYNDGSNGSGPVVRISDNLFKGNNNIISVTLPSGIEYIGEYAFSSCTSLQSINLPEGIKAIDNYAFYSCTKLNNVVLPRTLSKIERGTFSDCDTLTEIVIPQGVLELENWAFSDCDNLVTISFPQSLTIIGEEVFKNCQSIRSISLPNSVITIGQGAFNDCKNLESILLPTNLNSIEAWVFAYCSSLRSVTLPSGITSIGLSSFSGAASLTDIVIPSTVTQISADAFENCVSLKTMFIPLSVITIYNSIASGCKALTIRCQASGRPSGWTEQFNSLDWNGNLIPVVWGYNN